MSVYTEHVFTDTEIDENTKELYNYLPVEIIDPKMINFRR